MTVVGAPDPVLPLKIAYVNTRPSVGPFVRPFPLLQWPERAFCSEDGAGSFFTCDYFEHLDVRPLQRMVKNEVDVRIAGAKVVVAADACCARLWVLIV